MGGEDYSAMMRAGLIACAAAIVVASTPSALKAQFENVDSEVPPADTSSMAANRYLSPSVAPRFRAELGLSLPSPREFVWFGVQFGNEHFEIAVASVGSSDGEVLDPGAVSQTRLLAGRVYRYGAIGGMVSFNHGWAREDGAETFSGIGGGAYGRLGTSTGLHLELGISVQAPIQGGKGEANPTGFVNVLVPIWRSDVLDIDAVARVWGSGGEGSVALLWAAQLRFLLFGRAFIGAALVGGLFVRPGISLGAEWS